MANEQATKSLLPDFVKRPILMLWIYIIPQLILLMINLRSYWIISDEITQRHLGLGYTILAWQIGLIGVAAFVWLFHHFKKTHLNIMWSVLFLAAHIGYLWFSCSQLGRLIPSGIEPWILNQGALFLAQFTFIMPGLFYAGLRLACFEHKFKKMPDMALSLILAIIAPVTFYIFFMVFGRFFRYSGFWFPEALAILLFIGTTVLAFVGIIRLMVLIYNYIQSLNDAAQIIPAVIVALIGPIGGLFLNSKIPFPADFQAPWVYLLAVINGLIVMVPSIRKSDGHGYLLFARSVTLPFTLYFFLVFLPFLPLSLPAMFAVGMGFLILVPVILFLFHLKRIYDDFKLCERAHGIKLAIVLVILGCSVLPGYFVFQATQDKVALKSALEYVYSPDYRKDLLFPGSVKSVKRTLVNLKKSKQGIQLPYLSGFYNQMVFEGMVLPDRKADYLYRLFTGGDMPEVTSTNQWGFFGAVQGRGRGGRFGTRPVQRDRNVELSEFVVTTEQVDGISRARLNLRLTNLSESDTAEFFRELKLPASVLITDFQLLVGDEMVPGRIFEKRAALWVYHMIRDFTQRDPGILSYKTPTQVDFNIYPFLKDQRREASIEFSFPAGTNPSIQLGDRLIALDELSPPAGAVFVQPVTTETAVLIITEQQLNTLPKSLQYPYLHFILDYSHGADQKHRQYVRQIEQVIKEYGEATVGQARFTAANFDMQELSAGYIDLNNTEGIRHAVEGIKLPSRGSLNLERIIKAQLTRPALPVEIRGRQIKPHPLFVVISHKDSKVLDLQKMDFFQNLMPYENYYLYSSAVGSIKNQGLWSKPLGQVTKEYITVSLGGVESIIPAIANYPHPIKFSGNINAGELKVLVPKTNKWIRVQAVKVLTDQSDYATGVRLSLDNNALLYNPSAFEDGLVDIVNVSKQVRIMAPSTSYIIVERSSQWKTLELKEKQRLRTSEGLEFEEDFRTPAPSVYVLCVLMVVWYLRRTKRSVQIDCGPKL